MEPSGNSKITNISCSRVSLITAKLVSKESLFIWSEFIGIEDEEVETLFEVKSLVTSSPSFLPEPKSSYIIQYNRKT